MNQNIKTNAGNESNLITLLASRFLPYWPLLILFGTICFIGAMAYMKISLPAYEANAILLVKDEKKGSDDSRMIDALNVYHSKKIVENEIEVIQSRLLMKEVVKTLGLYAPVSMDTRIRSVSAYTTTPIAVRVKDPENLVETEKVYFTYDSIHKSVKIGHEQYSINTWVKTPYGDLMFVPNTRLKTVTQNPLFFSLVPTKKVVTDHIRSLSVSAANKMSSVVTLTFVDEVPVRAEDVLNELIKAYDLAGINDKNALADNTMQFVDERLKHVKVEIDSIEKEIQLYRSGQGAVNLSEQSSVFLRNVGDNDQKAAQIEMQLEVLNQVQKFVNSGQTVGNIVPSSLGINDPVLAQLMSKLSTSELEYQKLKNTTAENSPVLVALSNEIKQLRFTILESINIQRINLKASSDHLNQTNKKYSDRLLSIPEKERKLLEISRQQMIINDVYNFLLQKKEETALSYASTVPDSRVLDVAESPIKPVSPKRTIVFGVAIVLTGILTFLVIFIKDFASRKILFRSEINKFSKFPVFGELPYLKKRLNEETRKEVISQQLFQVIALLGLFNKHNTIKKILLTSTIAGEGKSFVSVNLARTLADAGKKVVLVDLDVMKATTSKSFDPKNESGISEFLTGQKEVFDIIHTTEYNNLFLVKAGEPQSHYAALFSDSRIENLFSYLEKSFDFIIIDTSAIDPVTDDLIISELSDVALYIVRHAYTPKDLFQFENNNNKSLLGIKNVGIIFNGVKSRGFLKGFGYGYGYSYVQPFIKKGKKVNNVELVKEVNS